MLLVEGHYYEYISKLKMAAEIKELFEGKWTSYKMENAEAVLQALGKHELNVKRKHVWTETYFTESKTPDQTARMEVLRKAKAKTRVVWSEVSLSTKFPGLPVYRIVGYSWLLIHVLKL